MTKKTAKTLALFSLLMSSLLLIGCGGQDHRSQQESAPDFGASEISSSEAFTTNAGSAEMSSMEENHVDGMLVDTFTVDDGKPVFPQGRIESVGYVTLSTEGTVSTADIKKLYEELTKISMDCETRVKGFFLGTRIMFYVRNDTSDAYFYLDLRENNAFNLAVENAGTNMLYGFAFQSEEMDRLVRDIVSFKCVQDCNLSEIDRIEFAETYQSEAKVLYANEADIFLKKVLACDQIRTDEMRDSIPFQIITGKGDVYNGQVSHDGRYTSIEQSVFDTTHVEGLVYDLNGNE